MVATPQRTQPRSSWRLASTSGWVGRNALRALQSPPENCSLLNRGWLAAHSGIHKLPELCPCIGKSHARCQQGKSDLYQQALCLAARPSYSHCKGSQEERVCCCTGIAECATGTAGRSRTPAGLRRSVSFIAKRQQRCVIHWPVLLATSASHYTATAPRTVEQPAVVPCQ